MSDTVVLPQSPLTGFRQGDVIAGKYRLDHELGRGAMGVVWGASHTTLGQKVAIKLIASDQAQSVEARHRFGLEAKAAARLKSRHAVQVYDDGETPEGIPYIVMEYLEGETLEARLERQNDLGLPEAIRITTHIGRALAKAHARGIIHRDLKSGNVFIAKTDDDELGWIAKVLDFGVAKLADMASASTTKTGTLVGTPLFMSPEQIRGASHVDHRADLYSLGIVFYNMVTGNHAFNGPSYSDVLVAICTEPLPELRERAPWLPEAIGDWFRKACARELVDRFQSADEMVEALREAAGPHSRLGRASVPEDVSGPSGTIVGHVPPHVMNTVALAGLNVDLAQPASDDTLKSRTDSRRATEPRDERPLVETVRPKRTGFGYFLFALSGIGLALAVVLAALVVRYAYRLVAASGGSSDSSAAASTPAVVVPAEPPPPLPPPAVLPPPVLAPSPAISELRATPASPGADVSPTPPPHVVAPSRRPSAARPSEPRTTSSVAAESPKAARPAAPDMGF